MCKMEQVGTLNGQAPWDMSKKVKKTKCRLQKGKKVHNQSEFPSSSKDKVAALAKLLKKIFERKTNKGDLCYGTSDEFDCSWNAGLITDCKLA